jgi:transcriptional regulator with XRE-family HTH domain
MMPDVRATFGQRLRKLRKDKGMSQEALALEAGLDRTYVSGVERGERNISLENIERLAQALGVKIRDLFEP